MKSIYTFIKNNISELISLNYLLSLFLMISVAWFFNTPALNHSGYKQSSVIVQPYEFIFIYFITLNLLLNIISHLKDEIRKGRINLLRIKFSDVSVVNLHLLLYCIFFFLFGAIPVFTTAVFQQWINAPQFINLSVFFVDSISGLCSYGIIWILLSVYLVLYKHSESKIILILYSIILSMSLLNELLRFKIFNMNWLYEVFYYGISYESGAGVIVWLVIITALKLLLNMISKNISPKLYPQPYGKVNIAKIFETLKMNLSKHHIRMIDLETQKIIVLFVSAGALVLFFLLKTKGADFFIMSKIYLGAIIPIAFSFSQQQIVESDKEAGMLQNILLKDRSYYSIIMNRWLLIILPQIIIVSIFFTAFFFGTYRFNPFLFLYLVELNIIGSILNLNLHIFTGKASVAKVFVLLFFYLPLRADIQEIIKSASMLNVLNIFEPIINTGYSIPSISQQGSLILLLLTLVVTSFIIMKSKNNAIDY